MVSAQCRLQLRLDVGRAQGASPAVTIPQVLTTPYKPQPSVRPTCFGVDNSLQSRQPPGLNAVLVARLVFGVGLTRQREYLGGRGRASDFRVSAWRSEISGQGVVYGSGVREASLAVAVQNKFSPELDLCAWSGSVYLRNRRVFIPRIHQAGPHGMQ